MTQVPPHRSPFRWFVEGGWYFLVVVASLGILTAVPFAHAATRLRTASAWLWTVLYAAAEILVLVLATLRTERNSLVGGLMLGVIVVALCHLVWVRRRVWPREGAFGSTDPAVAAAMAARARRAEARVIVEQDPPLARELRIGRPDLPRSYDDGGLVDLGGAPAPVLVERCGIPPEVAAQIVDARPYVTVDDVLTTTDVPYPLWERIRERGVVVAGS